MAVIFFTQRKIGENIKFNQHHN